MKDGEGFNLKLEKGRGGLTVHLSGPLTVDVRRAAWEDFPASDGQGQSLLVNLSGLSALDLNGSAQLLSAGAKSGQAGFKVEYGQAPQDLTAIFELAREALERAAAEPPAPVGFFEELGRKIKETQKDLVVLITFAGELMAELLRGFRRPSQIRWNSVLSVAEIAGVNAAPIVSLVSFLVGLIIAFQSAMALSQFGMTIYVADMVGIAVIRELGPLIAAIVLAGRSGSAFSAELGAMKAAEEVDAITTMGLSPVRELALPRVLASILTTPLITMIACFAGVFGGGLVLTAMDFSLLIYWQRAINFVSPATFYICVGKSFLFGLVVAAIGCQRGLAAGDGPGAVGQATTSGVVSNIVAIAVLDSLLAVLFYVWNI
ncbi:MAG: ABC transporter permease [Candidatus Adiutrix sp.]|nr:ABC transporter permease [Candidatus Adiutrix sp.]